MDDIETSIDDAKATALAIANGAAALLIDKVTASAAFSSSSSGAVAPAGYRGGPHQGPPRNQQARGGCFGCSFDAGGAAAGGGVLLRRS